MPPPWYIRLLTVVNASGHVYVSQHDNMTNYNAIKLITVVLIRLLLYIVHLKLQLPIPDRKNISIYEKWTSPGMTYFVIAEHLPQSILSVPMTFYAMYMYKNAYIQSQHEKG